MLTRQPGKFEGVWRAAAVVAAHQLEHGRVHFPVSVRANMSEARNPPISALDKGNRPFDLAQRPQGDREEEHHPDAYVVREAKDQIVVSPRLKECERALQIIARFEVLSGEQ